MPHRTGASLSGPSWSSATADLAQDIRYALRALRRAPGISLIAILTLTLGIGVTTGVVSVVDHVLLRALPFRDAGRLVTMAEQSPRAGGRGPSAPTVADLKRDPATAQVFDGLTFVRGDGAALAHGDATEAIGVAYVEPDFFPIVGARPVLGRVLLPDDHRADAAPVAVLSYQTWQRSFGGDRSIVGQTVAIDGTPTTVVGVMPRGGAYPTFASAWQPVSHYAHQEILTRRGVHADSRTVARLKTGVSISRATSVMATASQRLAEAYPLDQAGWTATFAPLRDDVVGPIGPTLYTLAGAALAVLLLTCANVANLLLGRAVSRAKELAVRSAIGASRARVVRQLLTESLVLSAIGGALGTGLAALAIRFARQLGDRLPRTEELLLDQRALGVAGAAVVLTVLMAGLWPALRASRGASVELLRSGGTAGLRSDVRLRRALVSAQFALALVLLVSAGLLVQSFRRVLAVDIGFDPHGLIAVRLNPSQATYGTPAAAASLYGRLIEATRAVPGVTDAAFIQHIPFAPAAILTPIALEGQATSGKDARQVYYRTVSDGYLKTMKMQMASGRWFDATDMRSPGGAFVVNQTLARQLWPETDAVGRRVMIRRASQARSDFGEPLPGTIVGVIRDVHQIGQDVSPQAEIYVPYTLEPWVWGSVVIRAREAARAIPALRDAISAVDPTLIERGAQGSDRFVRFEKLVDDSLGSRRLAMGLIGAFGACAIVLAAIGMYGVVSYGVTQRTRELGVRKALGASDRAIARLVLRESLLLAAGGVVAGCGVAWGVTRLIRGQLFQTPALDPLAYTATIALLVGIAVVATVVPMRRAVRLDPTIAIRGD